jgi:rhamnose utilization protein RhaD (predicted bifunctional aldolase and dehydrogenase)
MRASPRPPNDAALAAALMPRIRGRISTGQHKVGHFDDSPPVLEFVNSARLGPLAALGTSCPDHFLRTKIRPLVLDFDPAAPDLSAELARCDATLEDALGGYSRGLRRVLPSAASAARQPADARCQCGRCYLVPGVGMFSFARDKATARIAAEFYVNAINVMREAERVDSYVALPEQQAFDIEYWLLEEAKLQRMPPPKSLAGKMALVTGGAGGIGSATARRLLGRRRLRGAGRHRPGRAGRHQLDSLPRRTAPTPCAA